VRPYQEFPQFAIAGLSGVHNFDLCGSRGYGALSIYFTPVRIESNPGMPDLRSQGAALAEAAERSGRDPERARRDWRICREVYVSDSKDAAMSEIRESLRQSYDYLFKIGLAPLMKRDADMSDADVTFDWMVENIPWIIDSPAECRAQIHDMHDDLGGRNAPLQLPESGSLATGGTGPSSCLLATSPRTSAAETTNASALNWPTTPSAESDSNTLTPPPWCAHRSRAHPRLEFYERPRSAQRPTRIPPLTL
jgi:hypothetical protein